MLVDLLPSCSYEVSWFYLLFGQGNGLAGRFGMVKGCKEIH